MILSDGMIVSDGVRLTEGAARRPRLATLASAALLAALIATPAAGWAQDRNFRRGDANGDRDVNVSDALATFNALFSGGTPPGCEDAADSNDDSSLDISDGVFTLLYLFAGGSNPPAPGPDECGPDPTADGLSCVVYDTPDCDQPEPPTSELLEVGHILNRAAYGPTQADIDRVNALGIPAWTEQQLQPGTIDESDNVALATREDALFVEFQPAEDSPVVPAGAFWRLFRGTAAPPAGWHELGFDASGWEQGLAGVGYGDGDDATVLEDMQGSYLTAFLRLEFEADPATIDQLILRIDYDDAFVAYLNGQEVARRNVSGSATFDRTANGSHEAGTPEDVDITAHKAKLVSGTNVLAVSGHNRAADSSDFSLDPSLINRRLLPGEPQRLIDGIDGLQQLVHVRGVYSRRQLQEVLAEFWENHFTTDYDKVAEYLDDLQNSDATDAMGADQARREAAQLEYLEYEFFRQHALGDFGDMLLYSATSPSMLIYLDNVLNVKVDPNENYAREILELYAMGVDNRYTQFDIEELAKTFSGWFICKVAPEEAPSFPDSARNPPIDCGVQFADSEVLGLGSGWKYFKGMSEPAPGAADEATTDWTLPGFDDGAWLDGSTGIGYGDGDDATVLGDMRNSYLSVYLRRSFVLPDPATLKNLILEVAYDDGFVAYVNGVEVARSETMYERGNPPAFDRTADDTHEVDEGVEYYNLNRFLGVLEAGENTLAIQVHNGSLGSSDLSMLPRLIDREILPGSIENGDPHGVWTFRFDPDEHHLGTKVLFDGTPYEINIPAGRTGEAGLQDAIEVIDALVSHPSTAEFICIKLIQRFVSDGITLGNYKSGDAPPELVELLANCLAAWNSTTPNGNIETVMRVILDPAEQGGEFWHPSRYRAKVKTPIEYINSTIRVLDGLASGSDLPDLNDDMGMHLFTRDEPDGWSELGVDWMDTGTLLSRIEFSRRMADAADSDYSWDAGAFVQARGLTTAEDVVDYFDDLLFQGTLPDSNRSQLVQFLTTDTNGNPLAFDPGRSDFETRIEELVGLLLSLPQWNFQ